MRQRKALFALLLTVVVLASLALPAATVAQASVIVGIGPDPVTSSYTANVAPAGNTTLKMVAMNIPTTPTTSRMATYDMVLTYNPAVINVVDPVAGGTTAGFTTVTSASINNTLGTVNMVHFTTSGAGGNVHFANVTVTGVGSAGQSSTVTITINNLTDENGTEIDLAGRTTQSATVNIIGANFTGAPTAGAAPLAVQFNDTSTGAIASWAWTFGDGGTSTLQNPLYTYTAGGVYTVSLAGTWSDPPGFTNTATKTGYISVIQADFVGTPLAGTAPLTVQFTDMTTGPAPDSWSWTFGDGGTSTLQNPSHAYAAGGLYTVSLTATNSANGISDTETKIAYVNVVVADFSGTPTQGAAPLDVTFTDASTGSPNTWAWTFGDGGTSTLQNPTHQYTAGGAYNVSLTATNSATGATNTVTKNNYIKVVSANFTGTPTSGMVPLDVTFTNTSAAPAGDTLTYSWTFGDGGTSTLQNPSHQYTTAGDYTVALTTTDTTLGVADTETKVAYIHAMTIVANTSIAEELLSKTDVVRVRVDITGIKNPDTGLPETAPGGIASYEATATYTTGGVSMKAVQTGESAVFGAPLVVNIIDGSGQTLFNDLQTGSAPQPPINVAKMVPILTGSALVTVTLGLDFTTISDANGANIPEDATQPPLTLSFKRGDANKDASITIVDALFIAQYLANLRSISTMGALNAASVSHDGASGDKITIVDALFIAQYKALIKNDLYQ